MPCACCTAVFAAARIGEPKLLFEVLLAHDQRVLAPLTDDCTAAHNTSAERDRLLCGSAVERGRRPKLWTGCGVLCSAGGSADGNQLIAKNSSCGAPFFLVCWQLWSRARLALRIAPACRRALSRIAQRETDVTGRRGMGMYARELTP